MKKMILLMCVITITAMSGAAIIYSDDFSGTAGTDLNGRTPTVTTNGAAWVAGADFDADGKIVFTNADGSLGDSAYLPFVPQSGYVYTFSAKVDTRPSVLRANNPNDWIAMGFSRLNATPASRFYDDPTGTATDAVYWMMTRTNLAVAANYDQDFIGRSTGGGQTFAGPALSCDYLKIVLNTITSTWTASWYFSPDGVNYTLDRTVNVGTGFTVGGGGADAKAYFNYIMLSNNRSDGFIDDLLLTGIPITAWNPTPANNAIGVSDTSAVFQWNKGRDSNDDPNSNVTGYSLTYISYPAATAPAEPNFLSPAAVTVAVAVADPAQYPANPSVLNFGADKVVFWRVNQITASGMGTGNTWKFATVISVPIITAQPVNTTADLNGTASFAVSATSTLSPIGYTWYKTPDTVNNTPIDDAVVTDADSDPNILRLSSVTAANDGYYYCKVTNPGPVATYSNVAMLGVKRELVHWTLDNDAQGWDGTLYLDETPLATDSVLQNADPNGTPAFSAGKIGDGVTVDAVNSYASAGTWNPSQFTNQFTVALWAKWAGQTTPTRWQGLISKETSYGAGNMMWQLEVTSAAQASSTVVLKNGLETGNLSTPPLPVDAWEYLVVTFNGTTATVYRNGVSAASGTWTMGTKTDAPVNIGISARSLTENLTFNGMLDDIMIYNFAKTATQVADDYYAVTGDPVCIIEYASVYDDDDNCVIDLADFAAFASVWLDCGLYPLNECP